MKLKEGEVICDKCNGNGKSKSYHLFLQHTERRECDNCNGEGKLDWIENVVGKKRDKIKMNILYGSFIHSNHTLISVNTS